MKRTPGITAIAVEFPQKVRTNAYWVENHPDLIEKVATKKFWATSEGDSIWEQEYAKAGGNPFFGLNERRVLTEKDSIVSLACTAARKAAKAADLEINDIDMIIVASMFSENVDLGDSSPISRELDYHNFCWSLNSTCAGGLAALEIACGMIAAHRSQNIMVITTCSYSQFFDTSEIPSIGVGDGTAAFVVSELDQEDFLLHAKKTNSFRALGAFYNAMKYSPEKGVIRTIDYTRDAGRRFGILTPQFFRDTCVQLLIESEYSIEDIDFFVSYNATGWYSNYCVRELNLPPEKTIDILPRYGNISCVSTIAALYHAQEENKIKPGDLILLFNHGFSSNNIAMILKWGDVKLGKWNLEKS